MTDLPAELAKRGAVTTQEVIFAFLRRNNENTRLAYEKELRRFCEWLDVDSFDEGAAALFSSGVGRANQIVFTFQQDLVERFAPSTVNRAMAAIRSMTKVARLLGLISWDIEVPNVKSEKYKDTAGPGMDGYRKILKVLDADDTPRGARNRAMICRLFERALRRFEVVQLDLRDVDMRKRRVRIIAKARTEYEWHTISRQTLDSILSWVIHRGDEPGPLFSSLDPAGKGDGRLTKESLSRLVRQIGKKAGVKVWPHALRHTAITAALDATDGDVRKVMRFSRHKKVETVMVYDDNRRDFGGEVSQLLADQVSADKEES
jgi:integrase/recombinase XerC